MYWGLLNKIGLNDLKKINGKKRKLLGTIYAKYLRLLQNFYNNTYALLITKCTKISPSWLCVVVLFDKIKEVKIAYAGFVHICMLNYIH